MAKQKRETSKGLPPGVVWMSDPPTTDPAVPVIAEGKRKSRLRSSLIDSIAGRRPKRDGKNKLKVKLAERTMRQADDVAGLAEKAGKAATLHKVPRRPMRLGRLERLELAIEEVRHGGRTSPRTRKLQTLGVPKMAQKVIEEAGEVAIEALQANKTALVNESVDLLYNLLVLLSASGVTLEQVWAEMDRRELTLGMAEKMPKFFDPEG